MKPWVLNKQERMLLALLKAALHQKNAEQDCFRHVSEEDWKECYRLASRQGVKALAWDGMKTLPEDMQPSFERKLVWTMRVEDYEKQYARYCRTMQELSSFYAERGITTVQIKGVGLSAYYPIPAHREGGDIDIFTLSADHSKMTDEEANHLADKLMEEQGIEVEMHSYKHSNFFYKRIPIENHKSFVNVKLISVAVQVNDLLMKCIHPQPTELLNGECRILTPSPAFNILFLAFHAVQHYGSGLSLHNLCDWAVLIERYGLQIPDELSHKGIREAIAAFTQLCNRYLGTCVEVQGGEELAEELLREILRPKYPHKEEVKINGKLGILIYKTGRFYYKWRLSNRILKVSIWKRIWDSIVYHVRRPKTIFMTGG